MVVLKISRDTWDVIPDMPEDKVPEELARFVARSNKGREGKNEKAGSAVYSAAH